MLNGKEAKTPKNERCVFVIMTTDTPLHNVYDNWQQTNDKSNMLRKKNIAHRIVMYNMTRQKSIAVGDFCMDSPDFGQWVTSKSLSRTYMCRKWNPEKE